MFYKFVMAAMLSISMASSSFAELTLSFGNFNLNSGGLTGNLDFNVYSTTTPVAISDLNIKFTMTGSGLNWAPGPSSGSLTPLISSLGTSVSEPPIFLGSANPQIKTASWVFAQEVAMPTVPTSPVYAGYITLDAASMLNSTYSIPYEISAGTGPPLFGSANSAGNASFSVSAVPEPTSMALLGLMTVGGVTYRKLRKAKKEPAVS